MAPKTNQNRLLLSSFNSATGESLQVIETAIQCIEQNTAFT